MHYTISNNYAYDGSFIVNPDYTNYTRFVLVYKGQKVKTLSKGRRVHIIHYLKIFQVNLWYSTHTQVKIFDCEHL